MYAIQFWKTWPKIYQRIGFVIALFFLFSLLFLWYAQFHYPALPWNYIQELEAQEIPVHSFEQGPLTLTVHGNNYFIFEQMLGAPAPLNVAAGYILIGMLFCCVTVWLSIITMLRKFWYYLGMGFFILFIISLRIEIIQAFGLDNKFFTALILGIYVAISFYFQFFKNTTPFITRLLTFFITACVLAVVAVLFATTKNPLLHISANSILAATIISVLFILTVAHEIIASFVYVISQVDYQRKNLNHFLVISAIYMVNLALAYAHRIDMIGSNYVYINLLFLLTLSGILGIWGFHHREPQYKNIFPANPFGIYFILCMAITCFVTIGYFLSTTNDAPLVAIDDAILYSHIGYGIIFLTYVFSNFVSMLASNIPIYKILYIPNKMPYFTFRFAGFIATLAFVFYNTWQTPVNNVLGGVRNAQGDVYQYAGDTKTAEAFYQRAGTYGFLNHHSNYAIAHIQRQRYNSLKERNFYTRATQRRPTEFSYLNLSQTFQREQNWLEALLTLQHARKDFPTSGPIANAIGIVYSKLNLTDSALFFFEEAMKDGLTEDIAKTNFAGVLAKNNPSVGADSLLVLFGSGNKSVQSNALALANLQGTTAKIDVDLEKKTPLDLFSATLINNYIIAHIDELDTTFIDKVVQLARQPVNANFGESLLFSAALALYASGQVWDALLLLEELASFSEQQGRYNSVMALWALEQGNPQGALTFLDYSLKQDYNDAEIASAVARSEVGDIKGALLLWKGLQDTDTKNGPLAKKMIRALKALPHEVAALTDEEKYIYCHYRIDPLDVARLDRVVAQIERPDTKVRVLLEASQKLFKQDKTRAAIRMLQKIKGRPMRDKALYKRVANFEMDLFAKQQNMAMLSEQVRKHTTGTGNGLKLNSRQIYYDALLSEWAGDSVKAQLQYSLLATNNPYHEEAIIASAAYFRKLKKDDFKPYTILVEALHYNPYSVKLLKAYSLEAARVGLDEYASNALERLQALITDSAMKRFLQENREALATIAL